MEPMREEEGWDVRTGEAPTTRGRKLVSCRLLVLAEYCLRASKTLSAWRLAGCFSSEYQVRTTRVHSQRKRIRDGEALVDKSTHSERQR